MKKYEFKGDLLTAREIFETGHIEGLNFSCFRTRLNKCKSEKEIKSALNTPLKVDVYATKKNDEYVIDHLGNTYSSFKEMCNAYRADPKLVDARMRCHGWSLEDALTRTKGQRKPKRRALIERGNLRQRFPFLYTGNGWHECVDHNGQVFPTISAMCKAYGLSSGTFVNRLEHLGSKTFPTLEVVLCKPARRRNNYVEIGGKHWETVAEFSKSTGISDEVYFYLKKTNQMDKLEKMVA